MSYRPQDQPGPPGWGSQVEASASEPPPQGSGTVAEDAVAGARSSSREPPPVRKPPKGRAWGPRSQRSSSRDAALKCAALPAPGSCTAAGVVGWGLLMCVVVGASCCMDAGQHCPQTTQATAVGVEQMYSGKVRDEVHAAGMLQLLSDIPWKRIQASRPRPITVLMLGSRLEAQPGVAP